MAIEQSGDSILITDVEGSILYVNATFERVTGYSLAEVRGKNPRILQSGCQDRAFYEHMWGTLVSGAVWRGTIVNRRKDGSRYTEDITISPVCDETGEIVSYVSAKRDITEELELRTQLQRADRMNAVGRLAGGIAHDFNNVLGIVSAYNALALEQCEPDAPMREDLVQVQSAVERASALVQQILAFARHEATLTKVLDPNAQVSKTLRLLSPLLGAGIRLEWDPADGLWPICIDPGQLDRVLTNLVLNARDAIDGRGVIEVRTANVRPEEVDVATRARLSSGSYVSMSVADDGCGIDAHALESVFEPFFTTKQERGGTGLGLSVVYGIVEQNGGLIRVDGERDLGARFVVYLPRHIA